MSTLLSRLVDNLFEINKEECKACMNGENIESGCDFIGLKNNNSRYKCKECEKIWLKPSLLSLANRFSEITKKEFKACMERKNIKSECEFIGPKSNKLSYKCKECEKKWSKPVNGLIKSFQAYINFAMVTLIIFFCH